MCEWFNKNPLDVFGNEKRSKIAIYAVGSLLIPGYQLLLSHVFLPPPLSPTVSRCKRQTVEHHTSSLELDQFFKGTDRA